METANWSTRRHYTKELRRMQDRGYKIVCSLLPHEGTEVVYQPRTAADPEPWVVAGVMWGTGDNLSPYRLNGRECHAVDDQGNWVDQR